MLADKVEEAVDKVEDVVWEIEEVKKYCYTKQKTTTENRYDILPIRYRTLFQYKPGPMPSFFRHTLRSRIQNLNLFWGPHKFFGASEAGKYK